MFAWRWGFRRRKRQLLIAHGLLGALLLIFNAPALPLKSLQGNAQVSKIDCDTVDLTCLVTNLYVVEKELRAYTGNLTFEQLDGMRLDGLPVYTGIGFASPLIRLNFVGVTVEDREYAIAAKIAGPVEEATRTEVPLGQERYIIPLYIHMTYPPSHLPPSALHKYKTPLVLISVMWENLFRTIYAGVGAWMTLMKYNVYFPGHHRIILMDATHISKFVPVLEAAADHPVQWLEDLNDGIYQTAVLGITKDVIVAEIDVERDHEFRFTGRQRAFRIFCDEVKRKMLRENRSNRYAHLGADLNIPSMSETSPSPRNSISRQNIALILREGETRRLLNEEEVIGALKSLDHDVSVHRFSNLALTKQIQVTNGTDVFVTMHGAALTHILFLNSGSYAVEIFPYGFRKTIFRNLARIMGVHYVSWQNSHVSNTVFRFDYVVKHRFSDRPREAIEGHPIDWYNMDSKNYWRNQDTRVSIPEFVHVMKKVLRSPSEEGRSRYLAYLPWEQFNNQILGLKSACAVAVQLNRTLILPDFGYKYRFRDLNAPPSRNSHNRQQKPEFEVKDFVWKGIDRYFNATALLNLPCQHISTENFESLNEGRSIGSLHFHDIGPNSSKKQLVDYYGLVAKLPYDRILFDANVYYQLSQPTIQLQHGKDDARVLALGSMFWYYDFGIQQSYPLSQYYDFMNRSQIYREIQNNLIPHASLQSIAERFIASYAPDLWVALHVRRGDYADKCSKLTSPDAKLTCWPTSKGLAESVAGLDAARSSKRGIIYISTNAAVDEDFDPLAADGWRILTLNHVEMFMADSNTPFDGWDPIDKSIIEQLICSMTNEFIGNLHSSFTRAIVEMRQARELKSRFFGSSDK